VDPNDLERIRDYAGMEEYLAFARIRPEKWEQVVQVLEDNEIYYFDAFLFPKMMQIRKVVKMGIKWGTAVRLFACARRFYEFLLEAEKDRLPIDSSMVI
jgi:hypothetical protein